jgi:ribosome-associated translation inhibitor RaiA
MDHVPKKYWTAFGARFKTDPRRGLQADAAGRTLKIEVRGVDASLSEILRAKVVRCVLLALSRFGPRVRKVTVHLAEPVNPLGGVDQRCRMRVWMRESDDIHAEAINGRIEAAVARAAAQLARRVDSTLDGGARDGAGTARRGPRRRTRSR